jgi:TRAP transporter TAXI family solute receptor
MRRGSTWIVVLALVSLLSACGESPDQNRLADDMRQRVTRDFQPGLLQLVRIDRQGSAATPAEGTQPRQVVYFKAVLRLARDFDFGGWDQPNAAALAALLGAGPRGIAGLTPGGNRAGDELRAFGSADYERREDAFVLLPPRGFGLPTAVAVAGNPVPPGAAETLLDAIRIALNAGPTDTNPTGRAIVEEELAAANLNIQARFARVREGLAIASGPASGEYWRIAEALTSSAGRVPVRNLVTDGSVENMRLLRQGSVNLAIAQADIALAAVRGAEPFEQDGPNQALRALAALYPESIHVVVRADSPAQSLRDLAGKRIGAGPEASGARRNAHDILTAIGAMKGTTLVAGDLRSLLAALRSGKVDAVMHTIGAPANELLTASSASPLRFLPIPAGVQSQLTGSGKGYRHGTIPARTYAGQEAAVETVVVPAILMADSRSTAAEVRNALDVLFATDFVRVGSLHGAMISPKTAPDVAGLTLHEGAWDYYAAGRRPPRQ